MILFEIYKKSLKEKKYSTLFYTVLVIIMNCAIISLPEYTIVEKILLAVVLNVLAFFDC